MTSRRNFLKILAGTALAPFIPAIAASPQLDAMPLESIMSGDVVMFARLAGPSGVVLESFKPIPIIVSGGRLTKELNFGAVTQTCVVSELVLEWGGEPLRCRLNNGRRQMHVTHGDTITVYTNVELGDVMIED